MCPYMFDQFRSTIYATIIAQLTFKRSFTRMCSKMSGQIPFIYTTKITWVTFKRPFTSVSSYMYFQLPHWPFIRTKFTLILFLGIGPTRVARSTMFDSVIIRRLTFRMFLTRMCSHMSKQVPFPCTRVTTWFTFIWFLTSMRFHMSGQGRFLCRTVIT